MDPRDVYSACGVPDNVVAYRDLCRLHYAQGARDQEEQRLFCDLWIVLSKQLHTQGKDLPDRLDLTKFEVVPLVFTDMDGEEDELRTTSYRVFAVHQAVLMALDTGDTYHDLLTEDTRPQRKYLEHKGYSALELRTQYSVFMRAIRRMYLLRRRERGHDRWAKQRHITKTSEAYADEYVDALVKMHLELQLAAAWVRGCLAFQEKQLQVALSYWKLASSLIWPKLEEMGASPLAEKLLNSAAIAYSVAIGDQCKDEASKPFRNVMYLRATQLGWQPPSHMQMVVEVKRPASVAEETAEEEVDIFVASGVTEPPERAASAPAASTPPPSASAERPTPPLPKGVVKELDYDAHLLASGAHDQESDTTLDDAKGRFSQLICDAGATSSSVV
jgi:hypothetical protein